MAKRTTNQARFVLRVIWNDTICCVDSDCENPFNDNSLDDIDVQNNENSRPSHDTYKVRTTRFLFAIPF